jgi:hypothetical protein
MFRFPRLAFHVVYAPAFCGGDLLGLELGALPDEEYKEIVGYDRHGNFHLREGEEIDDRDDGWAGDLDPGLYGGDAAGTGGHD